MDYPQVSRDRETNTAYLHFGEIGAEQAVLQLPVMGRDEDPVAILDFSVDGELLGVELLNAEAQLPRIFRE